MSKIIKPILYFGILFFFCKNVPFSVGGIVLYEIIKWALGLDPEVTFTPFAGESPETDHQSDETRKSLIKS